MLGYSSRQRENGLNRDSNFPESVAGLGRGIRAIAPASTHACALTAGGAVKCWGNNRSGQLGNGSAATGSRVPIGVAGLASGVTAIDAGTIESGGGHTCALTTGGGVKCWGTGFMGQLGNGAKVNSRTPVNVVGLGSGVQAISAGGGHTCALTTGGGVKCWGSNLFAELGDGTSVNEKSSPVNVVGLASGVKAISAGWFHTCALTVAGGVKCWGQGGPIGVNRPISTVPVDVAGATSGISAISSGGRHTCALTTGGGAKCWGGNPHGQLGNGGPNNSIGPVDVAGLTSGVRSIVAGYEHTCAITTAGGAKCWGNGYSGALGTGSTSGSRTPVDVRRPAATAQGTIARFVSPSRNLSCELADRDARGSYVYCQSVRHPHSVRMGLNGQLRRCRGVRCLSNPAGGTPTLAYGRQITVGRFRCRSQQAGVRCTVVRSGRGFLIDRTRVRRVGVTASLASSTTGTRTYRLRWPSRPGRTATYHRDFRSAPLRAMSLRVYGITVPRGFGFSFIVACEHRGPASLNWNWTQRGSAVRVTVKMTTGPCFRPGRQVAGTYARVTLRPVQ